MLQLLLALPSNSYGGVGWSLVELGGPPNHRYEPELFPAIMFNREGVHFTLHLSGSLIITGIKRQKDIDDIIYPVLVELSLGVGFYDKGNDLRLLYKP